MDWKRIITGIILAAVAILAIFFLPPVIFNVFIAIIIFIGVFEWFGLYKTNKVIPAIFFIAIAGCCYALTRYGQLNTGILHFIFNISLIFWALITIGMFVLRDVAKWCFVKNKAFMFIAGLLLFIPLWLGANMAQHSNILNNINSSFHPFVLFYIVLCVSMTDTCAYFIGKKFGKNKLCPSISPKKTIEGLLGGVILSECFAIALGFVFHLQSVKAYILLYIAMFCVIIVSVIGDLFESVIKRQCGVKDSSNILPGHGGVLDRIDSLLAALPVAVGLFMLFKLPII
jgi:phosphatidate cytidylyltransferase